MTLRFNNNQGKPDTRKIEYEREMVELGLKKAAYDREVEKEARYLEDVVKNRVAVEEEVKTKQGEVKRLEEKIEAVRSELSKAVLSASQEAAAIKDRKKFAEKEVVDQKVELEKLEQYLVSLNEKIDELNSTIKNLRSRSDEARTESEKARSTLSSLKNEKEEIETDIKELILLKVEITDKLTAANAERQEVEDIVRVLKENNKEGLELVASFDGERKRLQEKEDLLKRKEADLLVYENRLKKHCIRVGYDVEMIFK